MAIEILSFLVITFLLLVIVALTKERIKYKRFYDKHNYKFVYYKKMLDSTPEEVFDKIFYLNLKFCTSEKTDENIKRIAYRHLGSDFVQKNNTEDIVKELVKELDWAQKR